MTVDRERASDAGKPELIALLGSALGEEKSKDLVEGTMRSLALDGSSLSREQALDVLERIADADGIVGITARFAKSRLYMRWSR